MSDARLEDSAADGERICDVGDEHLLPSRMAAEMKAKLEANRHKLHWRSPRVQTEYLALRLYEEVAELLAAVRSGVRADAWAEAADVANFAAMLADRTREDGLLPPLPYERSFGE